MQLFMNLLRHFIQVAAPLFALILVSPVFAGGSETIATSANSGIKLAQQGKAAPAAPKGAQPPSPPAAEESAAWAVTCSNQVQNKFICEMT